MAPQAVAFNVIAASVLLAVEVCLGLSTKHFENTAMTPAHAKKMPVNCSKQFQRL
jgi:hypothetical protein